MKFWAGATVFLFEEKLEFIEGVELTLPDD